MFYFALPPLPPPIVMTAISQQQAVNDLAVKTTKINNTTKGAKPNPPISNNGKESIKKAQNPICISSQAGSKVDPSNQKSDLVNSLLQRIKASYSTAKTLPIKCDNANPEKVSLQINSDKINVDKKQVEKISTQNQTPVKKAVKEIPVIDIDKDNINKSPQSQESPQSKPNKLVSVSEIKTKKSQSEKTDNENNTLCLPEKVDRNESIKQIKKEIDKSHQISSESKIVDKTEKVTLSNTNSNFSAKSTATKVCTKPATVSSKVIAVKKTSQDKKSEAKKSENTTIAFEKGVQKNIVGTILSAIQELISFSIYTSIESKVNDVVKLETQNTDVQITEAKKNETQKIENTKTEIIKSENTKTEITKSENTKPEITKTETKDNQSVNPETAIKSPSQIATVSEDIKKATDESNKKQIASNIAVENAQIFTAVQELIQVAISTSSENSSNSSNSSEIALTPPPLNSNSSSKPENNKTPEKEDINKVAIQTNSNVNEKKATDSSINTNDSLKPLLELAKSPNEPFLVGLIINEREVGTLDIIQQNNTLLIPLDVFAELTGLTLDKTEKYIKVKTPLGLTEIDLKNLRQINGITYISEKKLNEILKIGLEFKTSDLTLIADLPWRSNRQKHGNQALNLTPDILAPTSGLSALRQELGITSSGGQTNWRSSTQLGGRIAGGSWQARFYNDFVNSPEFAEYFFYKKNGRSRYQIGRQQLGLNPLFNGLDFTGLQLGYSNLESDRFNNSYSANEILPRRSRPLQTFRGVAPPASFIQLRIAGVIVAQQQVGFNGRYEFVDVNLPIGQSNQIELLIFDRNNLRIPTEIRSVRINSSDLLLPTGGNIQLGGLGFSGNLAQSALVDGFNSNSDGKLVGFYQLRQGISENLTLEAGVQAIPETVQSQAGLVWRIANPAVLSASVASSFDRVGYTADLDFQLDKLEINASSQYLPQGFRTGRKTSDRSNHTLEVNYRMNNKFNLGVLARSNADESRSVNYILPFFYARPFSSLSVSGRPDTIGRYLLNATYRPTYKSTLSLNSFGDNFISDFNYQLNRNYNVAFGTEFGGGLSPRYSARVGSSPTNFRDLSWSLGLAFKDGDVAPTAGASMQLVPGLLARVDYQGIPSRGLSGFGETLSVSLVSDLSFAGDRVTPSYSSGISKERGAVAGQLKIEGKQKDFDLKGANILVYNNLGKNIGSATTDSQGNFFIGNLPEGKYIVELEPTDLPVELSAPKTSLIAEVANSAVTNLSFPLRLEYGLAGRITDVSGQAVPQLRIELLNPLGARIITGVTDEYGLYRFDGVPVGKYVLRIPSQEGILTSDSLPKHKVEIRNEFVYNQNLQLPISTAAKKK
jgi:hypothetical protein